MSQEAPMSVKAAPVPDVSLVSLRSCANALGISYSNVKSIIARGALKSIRIGRRRLVPTSEIRAYIDRLIEAETASP